MEVKVLRLFGFEVNAQPKAEDYDLDGSGSGNQTRQVDKTTTKRNSAYGSQLKKYECQFCLKRFRNSQALGGHQNAHKKERLKKRRMQLQERNECLNFYLHSPQSRNIPIYSHSLPWIGAFASSLPEFAFNFGQPPLNFSPMYQGQNLQLYNASHVSIPKPIVLAPQSISQDSCNQPVLVKPSPSYVSKDCQSLYVQLELAN
ncbi:hypothetical protein Tsubulata_041109 [Turnera subulata]|uniref:C2H2-type domain-containing protein n=1 Tax=Turnera subulata TaxID=218843 RepID=A0A9Q0JIL6_9ROSI|nr:hypothetical protein Tsubulata_041109 [Turnera subulata]